MPLVATSDAEARAQVYGFLAGVFGSAPTEASVHAVRRMTLEMGLDCPAGFSLAELSREYLELFVIPNPRYVAPYESVFRDEWPLPDGLPRGSNPSETGEKIKGLLMGESTLKVRDCYLRAGILPERELPDHISNELRFIAHMFRQEAEAVNGDEAVTAAVREEFLRDHLLTWIIPLRVRLAERDRLGFYRAAIEITEAVLREEGELVEPARPVANAVSRASGCPFHHERAHPPPLGN